MKPPPIKTLDLLINLTCAFLYLVISLAVLRFISPALISSDSDGLVVIGVALVAIWLIASITLAYHLFNKRRPEAATTKEENQ
ncbi:hypothetical protein [Pseudomonas putida]|uniref:hypothetical protein n=1 Tax=Pseudomonas putida TaxID=303 RepID=UPI000EF69525|nr:hypothetical protein [Pseudomonas putida]AYN09502.1 hypothetical protein CHN49_06485 [Pseudomonas putida]